MAESGKRESTGRHAFLVASGILLSRLIGLVRQRIFNHYFGLSEPAGAFNAAFKIPNFLQNLFGEGVLSASFIPVYARLRAQGDNEDAGRVAGAIFSILAVIASVLSLAGVLSAPFLIDIIAPGFHGTARTLTIQIVRILFPGAALLVMSAWCLGILNSHRKFFLSYTAPVVWNFAMIGTLVGFRRQSLSNLAVTVAWGSVAGSLLQFLVQLPVVLRLVRRIHLNFGTAAANVREVLRNFVPVFISRGVVQISGYVDNVLASFVGTVPTEAVAAMTNAQTINMLPVSLFGMAISAAELPAMSSALGSDAEVSEYLRPRLNNGLRRIAFFVVPSAMAFLALGNVVTATLFQSGAFGKRDSDYVWAILAGSAIGLLASTMGRLYSSTYYALRDTRTPLRFAVIRVALTTGLGYLCALPLPHWLGIDPRWGAAGLTASAGVAGWVEFTLLRRALNRRIGQTGLPASLVARLWGSAAIGAAAGWGTKLLVSLPAARPPALLGGAVTLGVYGVVYFGMTYLLRVEECRNNFRRLLRR